MGSLTGALFKFRYNTRVYDVPQERGSKLIATDVQKGMHGIVLYDNRDFGQHIALINGHVAYVFHGDVDVISDDYQDR